MFDDILPIFSSKAGDLLNLRFAHSFSLAPKVQTRAEKTVLWALLAISGLTLLAIAIFYVLNPRNIVGDQLVNTRTGAPLEIGEGFSPIYVKPVTLLFVAGVVFSYCFFALALGLITKFVPKSLRYLLLIISVTLLAMGLYEVLFNFTLWGALMTSGLSPNNLVNKYPLASLKINLDYATKTTVLWCITAFFSTVAFKNSLEVEKKNSELALVESE
jgi:hypothetical protein